MILAAIPLSFILAKDVVTNIVHRRNIGWQSVLLLSDKVYVKPVDSFLLRSIIYYRPILET